MSKDKKVDIKPSITMLSVLRHVQYTPWLALAEYVDNAIQSSLAHKDKLNEIYSGSHKLQVEISMDNANRTIRISDNSSGISAADFARALRAGALPPDRSGLSEFGMGLKSASCWFSNAWSVQTKHFESDIERTVAFDVNKIIETETESIPFVEKDVGERKPYTHVLLESIKKMPKGRTIGKIEEYLGDIYRVFLRNNSLTLRFNGKKLLPPEQAILQAPYYKDPGGDKKEWRVDIDFTLDGGQHVSGFAAIAETGSRRKSGFALFRRGRVIQGSGEEGYRPDEIFGGASTFRYLRIFGELHLDDFSVSHTKDGFKWDENEQEFIEKLLQALQKDEQFLKQADGYRVRDITKDVLFDPASLQKPLQMLAEPGLGDAVKAAMESGLDEPSNFAEYIKYGSRNIQINFLNPAWEVEICFLNDSGPKNWINVTEKEQGANEKNRAARIDIFLNHKIMLEYGHPDKEKTETLIRFATAITITVFLIGILEDKGIDDFIPVFNEILRLMTGEKDDD